MSYRIQHVGKAVSSTPVEDRVVRAQLSVWDAASIIVGIIIGVGIYETPAGIFKAAGGPWQALTLWGLGGLFALVGALCFAELASTYPRSGGEYVYLTRALGRGIGFLFAWGQLIAVRSGASIVAMAYIFGGYAATMLGLSGETVGVLAGASIVLLTAVNVLGVRLGKGTQNLLTCAKVLGLVCIVAVGLAFPYSEPSAAEVETPDWIPLVAAMIPILWTYAGWHEASYVAAEVRDRKRNLPRSLLLGTAVVVAIYLLVNAAYVAGLGYARASSSNAIAADLMAAAFGPAGRGFISILIIVSALGAINGMIITSSRIFVEFGSDHALFAPLGRWNRRFGTPVRSLVTQCTVCLITIVAVEALNTSATRESNFNYLVYSTAPVFWSFFLLTGIALFVLRFKDANVVRSFTVPFYPFLPLLYCACCLGMLAASLAKAWQDPNLWIMTLLMLATLLAGVPLYLFSTYYLAKRLERLPAQPIPSAVSSRQESTSLPG
jgi:amino acid transporter